MKNFSESAKRFFKNKNVVTILGIIIILVILYMAYTKQINDQVSPVIVPVAKETIQPRTEITSDMIEMVEMPNSYVGDNVYKSENAVKGMYSNVNTVIPAGSMFYKDTVITKDELPDAAFSKIKAGEIAYNFSVDMESTFGNSIFPGNKIDIYMKVGNGSDQKIMLGKLIENIEVLAVKDSSGKAVFENTSESRTPSMLIFGLPGEYYSLLKKASYMSSLGVELYPVPHGGTIDTKGTVQATTEELTSYINANSIDIPLTSNDTNATDELVPTFKANSKNDKKITITYPKGCGSTYTCSYVMNNGSAVNVTKKNVTVTFSGTGTLTAVLAEKDGTTHTSTTNVPIKEAN